MSPWRVIPSRMLSAGAGVEMTPPRIRKMFSPLPSQTCPAPVSMMASSKPAWSASDLASALLM